MQITVMPQDVRIFVTRLSHAALPDLAPLADSTEELRGNLVDYLCDQMWDHYGDHYTHDQRRAYARLIAEEIL